jgi:hypothetical protein
MALGIVLSGAKLAQKALKGSNNGKSNMFAGLKGKFAGVKDGIKDVIGKMKDGDEVSNDILGTDEDSQLRGRKDREREEAERKAAEEAAAKKKTMMMYLAVGAVALIFMMKKKR